MSKPSQPDDSKHNWDLTGWNPAAEDALQAIQDELNRRDLPDDLSPQALARLIERHAEYLEELGVHSVRVARRAGNTEVQPVNVDTADSIVRSQRADDVKQGLLTFGGLLWGAAISVCIQEGTADHVRGWLIAISVTVLVIATIMLERGSPRRQ